MAEAPQIKLKFDGTCPDCGIREVHLPPNPARVGDDFDWRARDYDGFRMFMLEELAARFPERKRWTPADLEVVIVEVMATIFDQLSDMADRVAAESFLETARRPETVRHMLHFIGYDAVAQARAKDQIDGTLTGDVAKQELDRYWRNNPHAMAQAKIDGPWQIHTQKRMVTTRDYALRLRDHPLVVNAHAWSQWSGSWYTVFAAVIAIDNMILDEKAPSYAEKLKQDIINFHEKIGEKASRFDNAKMPSIRMILRPYIEAYRMAGQEVILQDPVYIGIYMSISIQVAPNFFQSEMRSAITHALGTGPGGFFEPGHFGFGEDFYASDLIEAIMAIDGIVHVCLNRLKRIGSQYSDRAEAGFIPLDGLQVAVCQNDPKDPSGGYYRLILHGGHKG